MRIAFMGTPDFAVPTLDRLVEAGHQLVAVYTQPPRPAGRGKAARPSPVQQRAEALGIEVRTPVSLKSEAEQADFAGLDLDAAVVAAYGLILPKPILEAPLQGCFNVHASLLPRWRGAAPVQRAILAGDRVTGITIMQMEEGLDTGPMLAAWPVEIGRKTAGALTEELAQTGAQFMVRVLEVFHRVGRQTQTDELATYAAKTGKGEAKLDFAQPAYQVERQVRAFNPAPGAWFEFQNERIKVLAAEVAEMSGEPGTVLDHGLAIACGEGALIPTSVQRAGRSPMMPAELLRGFVIPTGTTLA